MYIENWVDGRKTCFDISVISPTQELIVDRASVSPGAAIELRKASKIRNHFENCKAVGKLFLPLIVETFGAWDSGAIKILKKMAGRAAPRKGTDYPIEVKFFFQKLSMSLQKGNAALLVCRDASSY